LLAYKFDLAIARAFSFEVCLVIRATSPPDPAHPDGMAAVAASTEKVARYIPKSDIDKLHRSRCIERPLKVLFSFMKNVNFFFSDGHQASKNDKSQDI
jgi:hypothetical protein